MNTDPQTDRVTAIYDAIDAFQRTHRLPGLQHAQIRGLLAEYLARTLPAAPVAAPPTGQTTEPPRPGPYRHYKGDTYEMIATARHTSGGDRLVVYRSGGDWWCRPLAEFCGTVQVGGGQMDRFTPAATGTEAQQDEEPETDCTCGSAGDAFVPLGHFRDCPAATAEPHPTEADLRHALTLLAKFEGRDATAPAAFEADLASKTSPKAGSKPEIVHGCPPDGSGLTPCCGRTPFELPLGDRISSEAPVNCTAAAVALARSAEWASQQRAATVDPAMCPRCKGDNGEAFALCGACTTAPAVVAEEQQAEPRQACGCGQEGCEYCDVEDVDVEEQPEERPRCPHCQLPHDLTPSVALACASIRASITDAEQPVVVAEPGREA